MKVTELSNRAVCLCMWGGIEVGGGVFYVVNTHLGL